MVCRLGELTNKVEGVFCLFAEILKHHSSNLGNETLFTMSEIIKVVLPEYG